MASLATLLLRDGTIYFLIFLFLNVIQMILFLTGVFNYVTIFITPLSSILVSRFIMNLRQIHLTRETMGGPRPSFVRTVTMNGTASEPRSHLTSLRFASAIVGNMGAPLSHGASLSLGNTTGSNPASSTDASTLRQTISDHSRKFDKYALEATEVLVV
ncbi:hypothetical protein OBBRIDRAFT_837711 [Obba rivulosa]|uniref:Uncharacterized protein n=1 Tax=Obba rivulosa TaxID=1052685 RepID=A0A8E2APH7_9APHY|nr:hypothetical protein OBBRIDRAFT_837711 [Obba rivulosa]